MDETTQEILNLVIKKMQEQGAYNRGAYHEFIEETIEYFKEKGKIIEDDDYELMENNLMEMWEEVEKELAK